MSEDQPYTPGEWETPWAEPFVATDPERAELATAFAAAIRRTGSLMQLMSQAAADRIGINSTDLNCLNILSFRGQMTAGELARETGLTTASITGVVDRLEEAGYVRRERDPRWHCSTPPTTASPPPRAVDSRCAGSDPPLPRARLAPPCRHV